MPEVTAELVAQFQQTGFLVLPKVLSADECEHLMLTVRADLDPLVGPAEYEADIGYPGAPPDRQVPTFRFPE